MIVQRFTNAGEFYYAAEPFLIQDEARNNFMLGLAGTLRDEPERLENFWAIIFDGQTPVLASIMTPPNVLIVTDGPAPAIEALTQYILDQKLNIPGVGGPKEIAFRAAELLAKSLNKKIELHVGMRMFQNTRVIPPQPCSGSCRIATEDDATLILSWLDQFSIDCGLRAPLQHDRILKRLKLGLYQLWLDPPPVSLCGATGPTPNGIRISAVYTPKELRSHDYASNCVASLTQRMLDMGKKFCVLYTDLQNPTSNKIYQQIGYTPICDWMDYSLV